MKSLQNITETREYKYMKLDYLYFVHTCAKKVNDNTQRVSRCMMCSRPFNYQMYEEHNPYRSWLVPRETPLHWNYIKGLYVCDHCVDDIDKHEIDLPVYWYECLINRYILPYEELKGIKI